MASTSDTTSSTGETCQTSLWKNVYHGTFITAKDRLKVHEPCTTITGKIVKAVPEKDGDYHIRIKSDAEFASMLNSVNKQSLKQAGQGGYFVVEPMCIRDRSDHGWNEIHPVSRITVIQP
jgi:hypothetical protein